MAGRGRRRGCPKGAVLSALTPLLVPLAALAGAPSPSPSPSPLPSLDDRGGVGVLETPSARLLPDGTVALGVSAVGGHYRSATLDAQLLPWLETTLRETVRPASGSLTQQIEGGIGLKARLLTENRWRPALALGLNDLAGGRFAAEYLVLNKRWYDFDLSLGLGWGRLGEAGGLPNPLAVLGGRYGRARDPVTQPAGPGSWFTGAMMSPFAGVVWQTPVPDLALKLEVSPDRHRYDRWENPALAVGLPVNAGLVWQPWPWLELGGGVEHGQALALRAALKFNPINDGIHRLSLDSLPQATASVVLEGSRAIAWLEPGAGSGDAYPPAEVVGRALREMAARAPPGLEEVTVVTGSHGLDGVAVSAMVGDLRRAVRGQGSPPEIREHARLEPGGVVSELAALPDDWRPANRSPWQFQTRLNLEQSPFESTVPLAYRASLELGNELELGRGLVFGQSTRLNLDHRLGGLDATLARNALAPPPQRLVRSDLVDYVLAAPVALLDRAYVAWLAAPAPSWQTRLSLGWFEETYAGIGGEVLYRPWQSRWALGLEVDPVMKRVPGNTLALWPGSGTVASHASLYYESDDGRIDAALHVGRYLGGDLGSTLELTRHFDNGIRLGAWFTGTTGADGLGLVQAQGRERFDGGLRLSLPLGAFPLLPDSSRGELALRPLGRDSGQRVDMPLRLEPLSRATGYGPINGGWSRLID